MELQRKKDKIVLNYLILELHVAGIIVGIIIKLISKSWQDKVAQNKPSWDFSEDYNINLSGNIKRRILSTPKLLWE